MAIALVNRAQGGNSGSATSITSPATAHTAGNLLVALISCSQGSSVSSITDTAGNTWIQAGEEWVGASTNRKRIYYAWNCLGHAANVITVNFVAAVTYRVVVVQQFSGVDNVRNPYLDFRVGSGSGTAISTRSFNPFASESVITGIMVNSNDSISAGSGYNLVNFAITGDATKYFGDEYQITSTAVAVTATGANSSWDILAVAFASVKTPRALAVMQSEFLNEPLTTTPVGTLAGTATFDDVNDYIITIAGQTNNNGTYLRSSVLGILNNFGCTYDWYANGNADQGSFRWGSTGITNDAYRITFQFFNDQCTLTYNGVQLVQVPGLGGFFNTGVFRQVVVKITYLVTYTRIQVSWNAIDILDYRDYTYRVLPTTNIVWGADNGGQGSTQRIKNLVLYTQGRTLASARTLASGRTLATGRTLAA